ncbi:MAG: ABC transporter permease [Deferrisomatales bacterium]|nr:ABC transporter permease [Deferrisomatales bacterium]
MKNFPRESVAYLASPVLVLGAWELAARGGMVDAVFFPPPSEIGHQLLGMVVSGLIVSDLCTSLFRALCGLLLGGIPGVILGILMARNRFIYYALHPLVTFTYPLPKIALIPLVVLVFGYGEISKVFIVSLGGFYLLLLNTYYGASAIDPIHFETATIGQYRPVDRFLCILLPGALPAIFNGFKLAVGICLILIVAAEFVGSTSGIGFRIWISWEMFQVERMYAALFALAGLGWLLTALLNGMERVIMPWRRQ